MRTIFALPSCTCTKYQNEERDVWEGQVFAHAREYYLVGTKSMATCAVSPQPSDIPSDLIAWFKSTIQSSDATFIVYYRGYW